VFDVFGVREPFKLQVFDLFGLLVNCFGQPDAVAIQVFYLPGSLDVHPVAFARELRPLLLGAVE
jgi:hypothetical protein